MHVLSRIKNIFRIQKSKQFDYGDIFLKSKARMDDDNKEMVIVKKGLIFARIQYEYAVLKFTYHQCFVSHV